MDAGWIILLIGIVGLLCGVLYTGGPYPLGYHGLGDLFVFLFFGIVAVTGTYYVNTLQWSLSSLWASLAIGALTTNILVVNNLRDTEQDASAGKNTLGVLFGENVLRTEYTAMLIIAFAIPPYFAFVLKYTWLILLPFLCLPFAIILLKQLWTRNKATLNTTLKYTGLLLTAYGILFSIGILTA